VISARISEALLLQAAVFCIIDIHLGNIEGKAPNCGAVEVEPWKGFRGWTAMLSGKDNPPVGVILLYVLQDSTINS
jgi:hypothetical protein